MKIKKAIKLLDKYDLMFGGNCMGNKVTILDKNQNYVCPWFDWSWKVHNKKELEALIKDKGKWAVWLSETDWYLGNILGNLMIGETKNIKLCF